MQIKKLDDLKVTNPYLRLGTDVSSLEKSIQTLGLIAPLVISSDNVILAGARRYQALLNLGRTEAPVVVVEGNSLEKELVSIDENLVRKDLTKMEIETHLRRAKEIYQSLFPEPEVPVKDESNSEEKIIKESLPAEKFLTMVSEKTGLSPKQIHEAISRDELSSEEVKEARLNGELSLSQTNEIVKLKKEDQTLAIDHIKELPVREIKKFVKMAKAQGVEKAIKQSTPLHPHQKDFDEVETLLKKALKKITQLNLEGINFESYPESLQDLLSQIDESKTIEPKRLSQTSDFSGDSLQ
jgi:ParB family chromosome partitioning protein